MTILKRLAACASDPDLCSHGDLVALCLDAIAELSAQSEEIARLQHDVKYTTEDFTRVLDERDAKDAKIAPLTQERDKQKERADAEHDSASDMARAMVQSAREIRSHEKKITELQLRARDSRRILRSMAEARSEEPR